jgi:hypothetical protein
MCIGSGVALETFAAASPSATRIDFDQVFADVTRQSAGYIDRARKSDRLPSFKTVSPGSCAAPLLRATGIRVRGPGLRHVHGGDDPRRSRGVPLTHSSAAAAGSLVRVVLHLAGRVTPEASPGGAVTLRWPQPHTSRGLGRSHGAGMPLMTALAGAMSVPRVRLQLCGGWWPRSRGCMNPGPGNARGLQG